MRAGPHDCGVTSVLHPVSTRRPVTAHRPVKVKRPANARRSKTGLDVRIKRAYEPASPGDGTRVLVDRLWPRGLKKSDAAIAQWMKEIAPSTELRQWFGHDVARWEEFRRRYGAELSSKGDLLAELREMAGKGPLTLIYSAHDEAHNQAVVLRERVLR